MMRGGLGTAAFLAVSSAALADTFTVTTNANAGVGTLRWAIDQANTHSGPDNIVFDPSLSGKAIKPNSPLPEITGARTKIRGDIDGDGDPDIRLNGMNAGSASGLVIRSTWGCDVIGLAVVRFASHGMMLRGSSSCTIRSCHVGVNLVGNGAVRNGGDQIRLVQSHHNTIGGPTVAGRNTIAAGSASPVRSGIYLSFSRGNIIRNNNIGIARDGQTALTAPGDSGVGITLYGAVRYGSDALSPTRYNYIGGTPPYEGYPAAPGNVFGGMKTGLDLRCADDNDIQSNYFGLARDGSTHIPINRNCIRIRNRSRSNIIGDGQVYEKANVISGGWVGIRFDDPGTRLNLVKGNYFGLNATGAHQRPLARAIQYHSGCGRQLIVLNVICGKHAAADPLGITLQCAGEGSLISGNHFGHYVPPVGFEQYSPHYIAVLLEDTQGVRVEHNTFYGPEIGLWCLSMGDNISAVAHNRFEDCGVAVRLRYSPSVSLGNLSNELVIDDGENKFDGSNTWYIRNESSHSIKAENNRFPPRGYVHAKIWDRRDDPGLGNVDIFPLGDPLLGGTAVGALAVTNAAALPTVSGGAEIAFTLSAPADVVIDVLTVAGRAVATVARDLAAEAGTQRLVWSGQTTHGTRAPNGTYLVRITARSTAGHEHTALCGLTLR